jgi:hypothetical protein
MIAEQVVLQLDIISQLQQLTHVLNVTQLAKAAMEVLAAIVYPVLLVAHFLIYFQILVLNSALQVMSQIIYLFASLAQIIA